MSGLDWPGVAARAAALCADDAERAATLELCGAIEAGALAGAARAAESRGS